jgi:hypothetical protein
MPNVSWTRTLPSWDFNVNVSERGSSATLDTELPGVKEAWMEMLWYAGIGSRVIVF